MKKIIMIMLLLAVSQLFPQKMSGILTYKLNKLKSGERLIAWVFFTDKGPGENKWLSNPESYLTRKSIERRTMRGMNKSIVDNTDFPICESYISGVEKTGAKIRQRTKWFNGASIEATREQLETLSKLPFIKELDIVYALKREKTVQASRPIIEENIDQPKGNFSYDYGLSATQLNQIKVPDVHNLGYTGNGVIICVMDAGFSLLAHEVFSTMQIIATYDFVNHRIGVGDSTGLMGEGSHGTETLSSLGGFKAGKLIGPAFGAKFILTKTENTDSETPVEEDNWIAAAEFADSLGADVTSTSLGYIDFDPPYTSYTWQSMDGNTCRITLAADLLASKGVVVVNSAGNEGSNSSHNTLGAPADGKKVITIGAVTSSGTRSYFSSVGNTVDGRIKPDVMAMGSSVRVASPYGTTSYTYSDGTSFSCPLAAGVAALVVCARPFLNPLQVRDAMRNTASRASSPDREYGYGILNALAAVNYFPATTSPAAYLPANNSVIPSAGIQLKWGKVSGSLSYKYQIATDANFTSIVINDSVSTDTIKGITSLLPNTAYYWHVACRTATGTSAYSSAYKFTTTAASVAWQSGLTIRDNGTEVKVHFFGTSSNATDGIDTPLGEVSLPPVPPAGVFDSRFNLPISPAEESVNDFRCDTNKTLSWALSFQCAANLYPVKLSWNPSALPSGRFTMKDAVTGTIINIDMKSTDNCVISNTGITSIKIEYSKQTCANINYASGWSLVSVPLAAPDMSVETIFPQANSQAYAYNNGYSAVTALANTKGYWIRHSAAGLSNVCGASAASGIPVIAGWNLIGAFENDVPVSSISTVPAGIINSQFYGYNNGYTSATTLSTGKGYWIRSSQNGTINISAASKSSSVQLFDPEWKTISITDAAGHSQTLYLSSGIISGTDRYSLPPVPPEGIFDARFGSQNIVSSISENGELIIKDAAYPVTISTNCDRLALNDKATNGRIFSQIIEAGKSATINSPAVNSLCFTANNLPLQYELNQNYPNPFNPSTTITFSLPEKTYTSLTIYNQLGQQIAKLLTGTIDAGRHSVEWNAANIPSGVYFYELKTAKFSSVRKLVVTK